MSFPLYTFPVLKVQEAIQHFEGLTRTSSGGAAHGETLTKLRELEASMKRGAAPPGYETIFQNPNEHTVTEHFYPGQEAGLGQRYGLTPPTHAWEDLNKQKLELAAHEAALQAQARAITEGHVGIAKHSEDIEQLREANSGLQKQLSAQAKSGKWRDFALGSAGAVGTVGAVTGMLYSNEASHKVQENQEHIDALKTEVARLKAQGQLGTSVAGPGAPIQGGPSAGAPQANGGLV